MISEWNPSAASAELIDLTRRLGRPELDLVILAEGNTSETLDGGRIVVKASGAYMADADASGFVTVDVQAVVDLIEDPSTTQAELTRALDAGTHDGVRRRGSIETLVHASVRSFAPVRFVAHTHPTPVIALLASVHARTAFDVAAYSDEVVITGRPLFVPYAPPGLELGRLFHEALRRRVDETGEVPSLVLLGNHGAVAISETSSGAEAISLMAVKAARVRLGAYAAGGVAGLDEEATGHYLEREDYIERRGRIAGAGS